MKIKKILAAVLSVVLSITMTANVFAKNLDTANTNKEEIVYISTKVNGKVDGYYVVNAFDIAKDQEIIDYGNYENVKNLSNLKEIKTTNGQINVEGSKGKFFYQGDNPDKELPWNINLVFYLDGEKRTPEEIVGTNGKVKIKGRITKNPKADPIYSEFYLGQLSINIDSNNAIVKKAEDATIAYQGSIQILNYTILPEKELEFEIIADSSEFAMKQFTFSAIPFNMNFELPDTSEFTDQLKELEKAISRINGGTSELTVGLFELSKNTQLLYDSLYKIYNGVNGVTQGQSDLTNGTGQFHDGLNQYSDGINTLVDKVGELGDGIDQLKGGLISIKDGSNSLTNGLSQYNSGLKEYTNGISEFTNGHKEFTKGIEKMATESKPLKKAGSKLVEGSQKIYDGLSIFDKLDFIENISKEDLELLEKAIDEIIIFWEKAEKEINEIDIDDAIDKLVETKKQIIQVIDGLLVLSEDMDIDEIIERLNIDDIENEDVKKLIEEIKRISKKLEENRDKLEEITAKLDELLNDQEFIEELKVAVKNCKEQIQTKLEPLKKALKGYDANKTHEILQQLGSFRSEYKKFHDGLTQYTQGTNQLVDSIGGPLLNGSKQLDLALDKIDDGGKKLSSNFDGLVRGSDQITRGLNQIISRLDFGNLSQINRLKSGMDQLVSNHALILDGQKELKSGLLQISSGLGEYINGFSRFESGVDQIANGADQLNEGTSILENETSGMSNDAKARMDEMMSAFKKEGFELKSFVDERNKNIDLVQFVYVSDSLEPKKVEDEVPEIEEKNFWEKILDIVTFWD